MASFYKGANSQARDLFKKAIQLDPDHAAAYAMAAWTLLKELGDEGTLTAEKQIEAIHLANEALGSTTDDAFAMARAGHVLSYIGHQYDRGASIIEQAILLNPNLASAWFSRGFAALMCGEAERGSDSFDMVLKLSPFDPLCRFAWYGKSFSLFHLCRHSEGLVYAKKALQSVKSVHSLCACILNYVGANQIDEAKQHVAALLEHQNDFTVEHALQTFPTGSKAYRDQIASAFERAGLPLR
jgi:adenylate cyclase